MAKKRIKKYIPCAVYLSVEADDHNRDYKEEKQLRYIKDFCNSKGLDIVKVYSSGGIGYVDMKRHLMGMAKKISQGEFQAVVVANMKCIASNEVDAYSKVGIITASGGMMYSVDEGLLGLNMKSMKEGAA